MEKKKILFVSQEIFPYMQKSELSGNARSLPQSIQEAGKEIRVFTPRFGVINERRHQLHEVIRLSGMNLIIDDTDHPLIIKVASISAARMQVYFIDNEVYFKRKNPYTEDNGTYFKDNDERAMFFCRGVLETVKKLGWQPDVIFCQGWMPSLLSIYIKKLYSKDPHFTDTKVINCLYNDRFEGEWDPRFADKLKFDGFDEEVTSKFTDTSYTGIMKVVSQYSDGLVVGSEQLDADLRAIFDEQSGPKLDYVSEEIRTKEMSAFFDRVIEEPVVI